MGMSMTIKNYFSKRKRKKRVFRVDTGIVFQNILLNFMALKWCFPFFLCNFHSSVVMGYFAKNLQGTWQASNWENWVTAQSNYTLLNSVIFQN